MVKMNSRSELPSKNYNRGPVKMTAEQIQQINEALASLGDYGEVHLIVQHGILKYINKLKSHKAWKDEAENGE